MHVQGHEQEKFVEEGDSHDHYCPTLDPSLDGSGRKTTTIVLVMDHEHFIPTSFPKYSLSGSVGNADYVFPYIYMH